MKYFSDIELISHRKDANTIYGLLINTISAGELDKPKAAVADWQVAIAI